MRRVFQSLQNINNGITVKEIIGFLEVSLKKVDGEVVVDMVEKKITNVDDSGGDGCIREKSLLWKGHMFLCKAAEFF